MSGLGLVRTIDLNTTSASLPASTTLPTRIDPVNCRNLHVDLYYPRDELPGYGHERKAASEHGRDGISISNPWRWTGIYFMLLQGRARHSSGVSWLLDPSASQRQPSQHISSDSHDIKGPGWLLSPRVLGGLGPSWLAGLAGWSVIIMAWPGLSAR